MGTRDDQRDLFRADNLHLDFVGRDSLYAWLAQDFPRLFPDEFFADLYVLDNGRPSVPPSLLFAALLLQAHHGVSDDEAIARTRFDLRWKVALQLDDHQKLCAKSTLQLFRARLHLQQKGRELLARSVKACREAGVMKGGKKTVAIDTTPIFGRGAVKDTYNLLADAITKLLRVLAEALSEPEDALDPRDLANELGLRRYFEAASIKGSADLDWEDEQAKAAFLDGLVRDANRVLSLAEAFEVREPWREKVTKASEILRQVLGQDIDLSQALPEIRRGVAKDRLVSVHDPESRHGHKSKRNRFEGHKGEVVVDTDSGVILDASVKAGNSNDAEGSLEAVERAELALKEAAPEDDSEIERTLGDCAYGTAANRRDFADAGRELIAKQARLRNGGRFTKEDFEIDEASGEMTCPAGHRAKRRKRHRRWRGERVPVGHYRWDPEVCETCPLRDQCLKPRKEGDNRPRGRTVSEHPEEELLREARRESKTLEFRENYRPRVRAEHRLARLLQIGGRGSRYVGRGKTELQWVLAAVLANLGEVVEKAREDFVGLVIAVIWHLGWRDDGWTLRPASCDARGPLTTRAWGAEPCTPWLLSRCPTQLTPGCRPAF